jgi:hypothetical protein
MGPGDADAPGKHQSYPAKTPTLCYNLGSP